MISDVSKIGFPDTCLSVNLCQCRQPDRQTERERECVTAAPLVTKIALFIVPHCSTARRMPATSKQLTCIARLDASTCAQTRVMPACSHAHQSFAHGHAHKLQSEDQQHTLPQFPCDAVQQPQDGSSA